MNGSDHELRAILGRVRRDEFVGRTKELGQIIAAASQSADGRGLLILSAPPAGASELLRQAYDELFQQRGRTVPIYYSLPHRDRTPVSAAIEFLNTFLLQYVAFRRNEPALCASALTLDELVQLAPSVDLDWIEELVKKYERQRFADDDRELVRLCLTAPTRIPSDNARAFVMIDAQRLAAYEHSNVPLEGEIVRALTLCNRPFVLAGLRRQILSTVEHAGGNLDRLDQIRLEALDDEGARKLVDTAAQRLPVIVNGETRDLLVQQLEGSPFFLTAMLRAAQDKHLALDSYLAAERLYVDELLGGRLHRYFASLLEVICPAPETRRALVSLLCEAAPTGRRTASYDAWRKRLGAPSDEVARIVRRLHAEELINWDGETIDSEAVSTPWKDYLRSRFRLDSLREPRALVIADVMSGALKRAPQTISRHYRRAANLRLKELMDRFNFQLVPRRLFYYDKFADAYKGAPSDEIMAGLDSDSDLLKLPQVFHTASGASFNHELRSFGEEVSVVAHAFEGATYTDANEVVWLVAKIDSKLELNRDLAEVWCDRLLGVAQQSAFVRTQLWLIAGEGFSEDATELLRERAVFSSSQQQFEILAERLAGGEASLLSASDQDEIEMVLPMGSDYELLAANTVEQVARRLKFRPEAINQIKTAIVEACINASEHSLSPDRKIYQRFRVEDDKLVVIISSRGVVPTNLDDRDQELSSESGPGQRRGWGLKLIKTLMDEVEFERVDEGTSLRMAKYVRHSSL